MGGQGDDEGCAKRKQRGTVLHDFLLWRPKLRPRSTIVAAMHDAARPIVEGCRIRCALDMHGRPSLEAGRDTWACRLMGGSQSPQARIKPNRFWLSTNRSVNAGGH